MKIDGLKYLNDDSYTSIMIRNKNNDIQIDVKNKDKIDNKELKSNFYNVIKNISEKEQINEIIKYYLKNNIIYGIEDNVYITRYDGTFFSIYSSRNMAIQFSNKKIDRSIIKDILKKYILDRKKFLNNTNIKNISIKKSNKSSYELSKDIDNNLSFISLNLFSSSAGLLKFEEEFLLNYIKNEINNIKESIKIKYSNILSDIKKFNDCPGLYIICDKLTIRIDNNIITNEKIYDKLINIIEEHNNLINYKKL